jgi:hypothetical protein
MNTCHEYICAICFVGQVTNEPVPKHCGHYMPRLEEFLAGAEGWLSAREYELSLRAEDAQARA